jgi:hypothetical protein
MLRYPYLIFILPLALPACSSFERDWENAAKTPASEDILIGRWQGTWKSDVSGHSGALRCIIAQEKAGLYQAHYHATYGWGFTFQYTVTMSAQIEGNSCKLMGSADLGWLAGGEYHYEGAAAAGQFTSTYRSKGDHGKFEMGRVVCSGGKTTLVK